MSAYIEVIVPGPMTTVQDRGRYGYRRSGIPVSGAMDLRAYEQANSLVGNAGGEAALEMTISGGSFRFSDDTLCALTGADMRARLDGEPVERGKCFVASSGSVLRLEAAVNGCRAYLAVAGGIDVPEVMGSRSTYTRCSLGGFCGRKLKRGDRLAIGSAAEAVISGRAAAGAVVPPEHYAGEIFLRVIPGPQDDYFTDKGKEAFYSEVYRVSEQMDRMGIRLAGAAVESIAGTDIVSDATILGSIQITGDGQPIVLMADCQTTGGYAKIATVHSGDLPLLAQAVPGTRVHFVRSEDFT